jgi:DHA1 family tetracycline resistance protein-like MFS transporter
MNQTLSIFSLLAVIFIDSVGWGIVYPIFTAYSFNHTSTLMSANTAFEITIAIYSACMFLFSPLLGALSDQFGRKKLLLASMIGNGAGFAVSATGVYLNSFSIILVGRIISGTTAGSLGISQAAIADLSSKDNKAYRLGLIALANGLGFTCGPLIGGLFLAFSFSLYISLLFTCLLAIAGTLGIYLFFNDTYRKDDSINIELTSSFKILLNVAKHQNLTKLFASLFLTMLGYITFFNYLPLFVHEKFGFAGNEQGFFLAYYAILFSFSLTCLFSRLLQQLSLTRLVVLALAIHIVFYLICFYTTSTTNFYFTIIPIAIFSPFLYVGMVTLISNNASTADQGTVMGIVGSICALTWALGPLLVAALIKVNFEAPVVTSVLFLGMGLFMMSANNYQGELSLTSKS